MKKPIYSHPCVICGKKIYVDDFILSDGKGFHESCFIEKCKEAGRREVLGEVKDIIENNIWGTRNDGSAINIQFNEKFEKDLTSTDETQTPQFNNLAREETLRGCGKDITQNRAVATEPIYCGDGFLCDECKQKQENKE